MGDGKFNLPPGFQFCPTDEDLVIHFLSRKALDSVSFPDIIPDLDRRMHNPWELDGKAMSDGDKWYFFSKAMMEKEATKNGFWKQLDAEEPVFTSTGKEVGIKKYFVFCIGQEAMLSSETDWVMVEYSLCNCGMMTSAWLNRRRNGKLDYGKWVLCRVYEKKGKFDRSFCNDDDDDGSDLSYLDEMFLSLDDDLDEICSS